MIQPRDLVLAVALAAMCAEATLATNWNRKVEALSVVPGDDSGTWKIGGFISAVADPTSAPRDLSTEVVILINGTPISSETFDISSQSGGGAGPCGPCDIFEVCTCGTDPHTGVFGCQCGSWLTWTFGTTTSLQPEDEIMVLLRPSPGALPETDETDDVLVRRYEDHPIFWNRRISSMTIEPSAGAATNFFDVFFEVDVEASYEGGLRLEVRPRLLINGVPWGRRSDVPGLVRLDARVEPVRPDGACPGFCAMNDDGIFVGECSGGCSPEYPPCNCCVNGYVGGSFVDVPAGPGDELTIILRPAPGALPELPGFPDDDEETRPVPCTGDADGNGFVNVDDLVIVILDWGCITPPGPCPGDLNNDGQVNVDDLVLVIIHWGPCFPV